MNYLIETQNLCKNDKKQKANNNISISVAENSVYGLLGPNGAGKSTLLKMLTGMSIELNAAQIPIVSRVLGKSP